MKLLLITLLALLLGAFGSGFLIKGIVFNLGVLAGVEIARWAKQRQRKIRAVGQIVISEGGSEFEITGVFSYYQGYWEFISGGVEYFSYDQGATWAKAVKRWGNG